MPVQKEPLYSKTSVTLIPSSTMKKGEATSKIKQVGTGHFRKHGEFLKKLAASKKEKGRRQSVLE
eukprot:7054877-Ditylum_brightwellii.AAC.1